MTVLSAVFNEYYDSKTWLGTLEEPMHRCLLVAADCLLAVLEGPSCQVRSSTLMWLALGWLCMWTSGAVSACVRVRNIKQLPTQMRT